MSVCGFRMGKTLNTVGRGKVFSNTRNIWENNLGQITLNRNYNDYRNEYRIIKASNNIFKNDPIKTNSLAMSKCLTVLENSQSKNDGFWRLDCMTP